VWDMQTICRCYLSEQLSILGWLFVTTLYYNLSLPYRVNVFQQLGLFISALVSIKRLQALSPAPLWRAVCNELD
jgi:hypothetical protein